MCACHSSHVPGVGRQGWWLLATLVFSVKKGWAGALSLREALSSLLDPFPRAPCVFSPAVGEWKNAHKDKSVSFSEKV